VPLCRVSSATVSCVQCHCVVCPVPLCRVSSATVSCVQCHCVVCPVPLCRVHSARGHALPLCVLQQTLHVKRPQELQWTVWMSLSATYCSTLRGGESTRTDRTNVLYGIMEWVYLSRTWTSWNTVMNLNFGAKIGNLWMFRWVLLRENSRSVSQLLIWLVV